MIKFGGPNGRSNVGHSIQLQAIFGCLVNNVLFILKALEISKAFSKANDLLVLKVNLNLEVNLEEQKLKTSRFGLFLPW